MKQSCVSVQEFVTHPFPTHWESVTVRDCIPRGSHAVPTFWHGPQLPTRVPPQVSGWRGQASLSVQENDSQESSKHSDSVTVRDRTPSGSHAVPAFWHGPQGPTLVPPQSTGGM